ncbi:MAG: ATP-grasp domain-containing protein [Bacteroidetes bacterium]|nr:ATP-grasp domain-containing protein [Bacteroidota bacterium]
MNQTKTINTILIANRGEIASRVIRTCRKMGIRSVAVFSDADADAPFVAEADVAVHIGESAVAASYLDQDKIIGTAKRTGADAIHPGYGFLSENVGFAKRCVEEGIIFIGPNPEAIDAMGSKSKAKALMESHDVPTVPGYKGKDQSLETLSAAAKDIGFPVLLKATAGGGGKGMRIVHEESGVEKAIEAAKRESKSAFGDDELIVEKYIASGRHIEFQIFGDQHGNAIHILERECTIQRRYQKVIEESPSPVLDEGLRDAMGSAAVRAAKALNYDNAGTVEFIFDDKSKEYYFLEVNTRLQVEHPVTEEITGLDLVQMQIESAQGLALSLTQSDIYGKGYAIECRLYAEDAANDFLPVTGRIVTFNIPEVDGLRVDTGIHAGSDISVFYDPMIAKLIVWDTNRSSAHRKMQYVLKNLTCQGITTNQEFLLHLMEHPEFQAGNYNTHFIEEHVDLTAFSNKEESAVHLTCLASCIYDWNKRENSRKLLRSMPSGWRNNFNDYQRETYLIGDEEIEVMYRYRNGAFQIPGKEGDETVQLISADGNGVTLLKDGLRSSFVITSAGTERYVQNEDIGLITLVKKERFPIKEAEKVKGGYEAPMPSQIIKVLVKEGQAVKSGDGLVVLSSMKMENTIEAAEDGIVEAIYAEDGGNVEAGFLLLKMGNC